MTMLPTLRFRAFCFVATLFCTPALLPSQSTPRGRIGAPLGNAERNAVQQAAQMLYGLGREAAASGVSQKNGIGDPDKPTDYAKDDLGDSNSVSTEPDRIEGGKRVYTRSDGNEVLFDQSAWTQDGQYAPGELGDPPDSVASQICLASALLHEYEHCLQEDADATVAEGKAACDRKEIHVAIYNHQLQFINDAIAYMSSQQLLSPLADKQLDNYKAFLMKHRDRHARALEKLRRDNKCG